METKKVAEGLNNPALWANKKSTYLTGKCFLMIIDNIGLHGFTQACSRRVQIDFETKLLSLFLKATEG